MIRINEIFGPTFQGEGPSTGRHVLFVRVSRCNLHCTWCDTPYTWAHTEAKAAQHGTGHLYDPSIEEKEMSVRDILDEIERLWSGQPTRIVISGGEPMLQQRELGELVEILLINGWDVEIETAGTIAPILSPVNLPGEDHPVVLPFGKPGAVHYNVSPKLEHSGNLLRSRRNIKALQVLNRLDSNFKFVVASMDDFAEVEEIIELVGIEKSKVWIMPEGIDIQAIKEHGLAIVDYVMAQGWHMTLRNHIWLWGEERGK